VRINPDKVSKVLMIHGPRGSLKSLYLSSLACYFLKRYYVMSLLTGEKRDVWTNYPVGYWYVPPDMKPVYLQSKPLNMESFYVFDESLAQGWVMIDEIDQWYDRQEWMSTTQKLLNACITQIRKKKLSIAGTLQSFDWLNSRAAFQSDIIIKSREAAFTPWGRERGLNLGEVGFLTFQDKSGIMTGYPYEESGREYTQIFQGKRFWNTYDTDYTFNPMETHTKYVIKRPVKRIDMTGGVLQQGSNGYQSPVKDRDVTLLSHLIDGLVTDGQTRIRTTEFWELARREGVQGSKLTLGQELTRLGIGKVGTSGSFYNLKEAALVPA